MTERDWRIFREDFSIAYKGTNTILPMRNWDEMHVPKEIRKVRMRRCVKKQIQAIHTQAPMHPFLLALLKR